MFFNGKLQGVAKTRLPAFGNLPYFHGGAAGKTPKAVQEPPPPVG
jgi:hypothetical protein